MAATPSLKVVKQMTYRGQTRRWSNRYHFNGGTPADGAHWTTFSDAVVALEKVCYASNQTVVQTVGYAAGSEVPVFTKTYATAGSLNSAGGQITPGDCAALVRYSTTARTPKNHPIYLYNYYHDVWNISSARDSILAGQITALSNLAAALIAGVSDGTNSYVRAGPNGATATGSLVEPNITHRDFPR